MIDKILFITLSNIGDVILTLPALDILHSDYPRAKITVVSGERAKEIFENNPFVSRFIPYNKRATVVERRALYRELKAQEFDIVVDMRNTLYGALVPAKYRTSSFVSVPGNVLNMRDRHIYKIKGLIEKIRNQKSGIRISGSDAKILYISQRDEEHIKKLLQENGIRESDRLIVVAAGARAHPKRWAKEGFARVCQELISQGNKVVLVGDAQDKEVSQYISKESLGRAVDLCAKTSLTELAALIKVSSLVITNDSAVLHLASYLNAPIVALFGPTDDAKYGPWSDNFAIVKKEISCRPCRKAQCRFGTVECLRLIKTEDVLRQVNNLLNPISKQIQDQKIRVPDYKRILIVRTDRIGDVLLSTPTVMALRQAYPQAYIAMMVSPYTRDIVEGNPFIDEVIVYDKDVRHKSWASSVNFARGLKKKKFDLAVILHPTNRVHMVTYFAGIPRRLGFNRKSGWLLTDRIRHTKQFGDKHESLYCLELVEHLGIKPQDGAMFMPIKDDSERWAEELFLREGLKKTDKLLAVHPGASCPSKVWPNQRFAQVADRLIDKYGFKVLVISGPKDIMLAREVIKNMNHPAVDLAGETSVSQLASVLKRCSLFISNDSGPVHLASAVGTPVVSIFGRSQQGLSPKRWSPLGGKSRILHKSAGCIECLAHNCVKEFSCLKAITADDVIKAAEELI